MLVSLFSSPVAYDAFLIYKVRQKVAPFRYLFADDH